MRLYRRSYLPLGLSMPAQSVPIQPAPLGYSPQARKTYGSGQPLAALRAAREPQSQPSQQPAAQAPALAA